MRKAIVSLVVALASLVLAASMNQTFINRIKQDRYFSHLSGAPSSQSLYDKIFIRSDRWRYGDLYGLCFLPQYKHNLEPFTIYKPNDNQQSNRVLYIIGDSFLADKFLDGAFKGFGQVIFIDRRSPGPGIKIDQNKLNYLVLEFAERNLNDSAALNYFMSNGRVPLAPVSLINRLGKIIFNKDLSRNIELLAFDDKLFTGIKELKATLNYNLFGRVAKEVSISSDKKRLLLNMTVDTGNIQSSFRNLSDQKIDSISTSLTKAENYYKGKGFAKVFLAVIPNAVSIYDAHRGAYNHLLEKVEKKTELPIISVYGDFNNSSQNLYYLGDAHWNPVGLDKWLKKANEILNTPDI